MRIVYFPLRKLKLMVGLLIAFLAIFALGIIYEIQKTDSVTGVLAPHYQGETGRKMISFTFNVDWGEEYIPELLKILEDKNVKATFFITGRWAKENPDLVKRIASNHEVGNHGASHRHIQDLAEEDLKLEITGGGQVLQKITGKTPHLFAPAYGEVNPKICEVCGSLGYEVIMWSLDTIDWQRPDVATIIKRVVPVIHNDAIILMHPTRPTLDALPELISQLDKEGYEMVAVSRLITPDKNNTGKK